MIWDILRPPVAYYDQQTIKPERVFVDGHADTSESLVSEQEISLKRATVVEDQLVKSGVPASKIVVRAFGDRSPLVHASPNVPNSVNRFAVISLK
jgi:outer membrane protein OmpA-like peptidoglycan-associated protein